VSGSFSHVLGDVAQVVFGTRVTRKKDAGSIYPVYGGGGATFSLDLYNRESSFIVSRFAMSEECVRYVDGKFFLNDSGLTVDTLNSDLLLQDYLDRFLLSKSADIYSLGRGTAQRNLDIDAFKRLEMKIPPLDEQKRIVAKLDEALGYVENLAQSIEMKLCEADLLEGSFISYLMNNAQEHSKRVSLKNVAQTSYGYTESASRESLGPKFLRITDIQEGAVDWEKVPYCPISEDDFNKHKLRPGDIVFARTGATTGKSFLIGDCPEAVAASYLIRVRPDSGIVSPSYLAAYFRSSEYWMAINDGATGSAQGGFNASKLGELEVPILEDMKMQLDLVDKLADFDHCLDDLRSKTKGMLADCNQLRSSILSSAFAGNF
jgi:type I restriction enzyme S subunit